MFGIHNLCEAFCGSDRRRQGQRRYGCSDKVIFSANLESIGLNSFVGFADFRDAGNSKHSSISGSRF